MFPSKIEAGSETKFNKIFAKVIYILTLPSVQYTWEPRQNTIKLMLGANAFGIYLYLHYLIVRRTPSIFLHRDCVKTALGVACRVIVSPIPVMYIASLFFLPFAF